MVIKNQFNPRKKLQGGAAGATALAQCCDLSTNLVLVRRQAGGWEAGGRCRARGCCKAAVPVLRAGLGCARRPARQQPHYMHAHSFAFRCSQTKTLQTNMDLDSLRDPAKLPESTEKLAAARAAAAAAAAAGESGKRARSLKKGASFNCCGA